MCKLGWNKRVGWYDNVVKIQRFKSGLKVLQDSDQWFLLSCYKICKGNYELNGPTLL